VSVKGRREEYAEATRAAIVEAAIERFGADGFSRTTIDAIAEAARVTKGGVYHHFSDKAAVFEAAFVDLEERLLIDVRAATTGASDGWSAIEQGIDAYLDACRQPRFRRIVLEDAPAALGWARWKDIDERYFLGTITAALVGLAATGDITVTDGELTARMVLATMGEAGLAVAAADDPDAVQAEVRRLLVRILRGLGPGTPPAAR
jgi:AcrR family transcriptional regulator